MPESSLRFVKKYSSHLSTTTSAKGGSSERELATRRNRATVVAASFDVRLILSFPFIKSWPLILAYELICTRTGDVAQAHHQLQKWSEPDYQQSFIARKPQKVDVVIRNKASSHLSRLVTGPSLGDKSWLRFIFDGPVTNLALAPR